MIFSFRLFFVIVLFCFASTNARAEQMTLNKIVAVVNGEMITLHEVRTRVAVEGGKNKNAFKGMSEETAQRTILDSMINDILLQHEGARLKLTVSDADVETEVRKAIQRSKLSQHDFESKLTSQGSSINTLREQVRNNTLRHRIYSIMVARKVYVPEEEVQAYYNNHKSEFTTETMVDFSIMSLSMSENPEKLYKQLQSKASSFEEIAKKHSTDANAENGGQVGPMPFDRLSPPLQNLLKNLQPGQLAQPVQIGEKTIGVFRLNKIIPGGQVLPFEQVKSQIEEIVREPLVNERLNDYVKQLRSKAVIDIRM